MKGRTLILGALVIIMIFGAGLYYSLNYAYYEEVRYAEYAIELQQKDIHLHNVTMLKSDRTPLKERICADEVDMSGFAESDEATPLIAPSWFECFDAEALENALKSGVAKAYKIQTNQPFGFDMFLVNFEGKSYVWRQVNSCGQAKFSGYNLPEDCPQTF